MWQNKEKLFLNTKVKWFFFGFKHQPILPRCSFSQSEDI